MLPFLRTGIALEEANVKRFRGINVNDDYSAGEIFEETNMSADMYPSLASRKPRKTVKTSEKKINGIGNHEGLIYTYFTDDKKIFFSFKGEDYEFTSVAHQDIETGRSFASLADSIMIIPDNIIFSASSKTLSKITVNQTGNAQSAKNKFASESNGSDLLDNASMWHLGKLSHNKITCRNFSYSASSGECKFYYFSFDGILKSGDVVKISMGVLSDSAESGDSYKQYRQKMKEGVTLKIKEVTVSSHSTATGTITETVELIFDDNTIDLNGYDDVVFDEITVERTVPELKAICSFNNRIWGITARELCCSKLGDACEWNDFSTDAYGTLPYACFSTPASTEGDFTAIASFGNYIYAFKEHVIHRLFGESPDEFSLKTIQERGIPLSKTRTLACNREGMFYCSGNDIYTFKNNSAEKISHCLEDGTEYICAAACDEKYYILCNQNGTGYIYVYHTGLNVWHREDSEENIEYLCSCQNDVIAASKNRIIYLNSESHDRSAGMPEWNFTLKFDEKSFEKKGIIKISVRYSLGENAFFTARALYDDNTKGAVIGAKHDEIMYGGGYIHIPVKRCLSFRLKFSGMGFFALKSLKIKYYRGSEI